MKKYYAVRKGREVGIFSDWTECEKQVKGYSGQDYKSFLSEDEARAYVDNKSPSLKMKVESEPLNIYVDGSFDKVKMVGGYGCVMIKDGKEIHRMMGLIEEDEANQTWNVGAELEGALAAIEWAIENNYKEMVLSYDYEGIEHWANGSWRAKLPTTKYYVRKIKEYQKKIDIEFYKVKAHSGDPNNELADTLAKQAIENVVLDEEGKVDSTKTMEMMKGKVSN